MQKALSKFPVKLKKKYYAFYYGYGALLSWKNFFYFLCFAIQSIFYLISDFFTWNVETANVHVEQGELRGRKKKSVLNETFFSFRGIPYAKAPLGPLRFKDPEPAESWTGVRDALYHGNVSAQWDWISGFYLGNEDSLFLNVYTPELPKQNDKSYKKKAVLFWIHGGGFFFGCSNDVIFGPDLFMNEDVILVTINYRLGPLGFLGTGTKEAPGNAGFKDAIQALKWVNKNISNFGGDPENVTVFGESAGGCMAEALMLSPLAKGLFHKVISQSGNATSWWNYTKNMTDFSFQFGRDLGIDTNDPKILVDSLRKISPRKIALHQRKSICEERKRRCVPFQFTLCAEPENDPNSSLVEDPRNSIRHGKFISDVPFMTGINEKEGISTLHVALLHYPIIKEYEKNFENFIPVSWNLKAGSETSKKVAEELEKFYLKGKRMNELAYNEFVDISTDVHFLEPFLSSTRSHIKYLKSPVYNYKFSFEGHRNLFKKFLNMKNIKGCTHSDEGYYLFHLPGFGKNLNTNLIEAKVAKRMVRLWSNFAKYGNPTPDCKDELLQDVLWPAVKKPGSPHLVIADKLYVSFEEIWEDRVQFWDWLKQKYAPDAP